MFLLCFCPLCLSISVDLTQPFLNMHLLIVLKAKEPRTTKEKSQISDTPEVEWNVACVKITNLMIQWNVACISLGYDTSLTCKALGKPLLHVVLFVVSALVCFFNWYVSLHALLELPHKSLSYKEGDPVYDP